MLNYQETVWDLVSNVKFHQDYPMAPRQAFEGFQNRHTRRVLLDELEVGKNEDQKTRSGIFQMQS